MEGLPMAALMSQALARAEVRSALPDAPVVPERPHRSRPAPVPLGVRTTVARGRTLLAGALQRAAVAVEPRPAAPPRC